MAEFESESNPYALERMLAGLSVRLDDMERRMATLEGQSEVSLTPAEIEMKRQILQRQRGESGMTVRDATMYLTERVIKLNEDSL